MSERLTILASLAFHEHISNSRGISKTREALIHTICTYGSDFLADDLSKLIFTVYGSASAKINRNGRDGDKNYAGPAIAAESCAFCGRDIPFDDFNKAICQSGHPFSGLFHMCNKTSKC